MNNRLPPFSEDAERAALGCILLAPEAAGEMLRKLTLADFYDHRHKAIFKATLALHNIGSTPDIVALMQYLKERNQIRDAGDIAYISVLPDAAPSASNFDYYLPILKDKSARRALLQLSGRASKLAYNECLNARELAREFTELATSTVSRGCEPKEWFHFYTPSECRNYDPPAGLVLVGDCHIVRGNVTLIAGPPGVGKSRALHALAVAGATPGAEWFGLKVHRRFKTAIIQNENGRYRLKQEFSDIGTETSLDEFIRVSDPPPLGMAFDQPEFRAALKERLADFGPDVVGIDPWNSIARDDRQRDYLETFQAIHSVLPGGDAAPALVIVPHTRKPKADERKNGRSLLNDVAGSHVLISVPRCVFVMQTASDEVTDERIIWTCCKNNDGQHGQRSVWYRRNGLFLPCPDFDWEAFDNPPRESAERISEEHLKCLFDYGKRRLTRKTAVTELEEKTGFKKTACYAALDLSGRFGEHLLADENGLLSWTP